MGIGQRVHIRHPEDPDRIVGAFVVASYDHFTTFEPTVNLKTDDGYWMPLVPERVVMIP